MARFPGVTGCIDCTHVRTSSPGGDDAEAYRDRKGIFFINSLVYMKATSAHRLHSFLEQSRRGNVYMNAH
ncbi:hypothetical protein HPB47_019398 [Ixodes persulcatus]|uniref:Uncharacterized protein n=2 Tax=Ixodes persulcatus TaxID=34615 RepID=A0AC60QIA4_IXOPE|nr:hypothetical protein HPB47_002360 [Ixodes persulcatus]KAG0434030.1 hypothetical protein HPB47_019398 [Ixodes persulcatus]